MAGFGAGDGAHFAARQNDKPRKCFHADRGKQFFFFLEGALFD